VTNAAQRPGAQTVAEADLALWEAQFGVRLLRRWASRLCNWLSQMAERDGFVMIWGVPTAWYCISLEQPVETSPPEAG